VRRIEPSNLTDIVYSRLKAMILDGRLVPGSKINKKELSEALAVSPTPISEAVSRLAGEKLLEQRARQGFFVREYDDQALADLFAVRAGLESIALRICIEEGSPELLARLTSFFGAFPDEVPAEREKDYLDEDIAFHRTITEGAQLPLIKEINASFGYILKTYEHGLVRPPVQTLGEHRAIVEAIKRRDAKTAAALLEEHHLRSRAVLRERARTAAPT